MKPWTILLLCFITASASEPSPIRRRQLQSNTLHQVALDQAKALWASFNTNEYSYHVRTTNFFYDVTFAGYVNDNKITSMDSNLNVVGGSVLPNIRLPTVSEFFDKIQEAIDSSKDPTVEVTYDSIYGYPLSVNLDYGAAAPGFLFFLTETLDATIASFVPVSEELERLMAARKQWNRWGYESYDSIYQELLNYQVVVRNAAVVQVVNEDNVDVTSNYPPGSPEANRLLVDKQFEEMENILTTTPPTELEVLYHPSNGYITSARIDYAEFTQNGENILYAVLELSEQGTRTPTNPTQAPTKAPTTSPTIAPTKAPTKTPTTSPTTTPTKSQVPTKSPTIVPTKAPTKTPTTSPTTAPTKSQAPTKSPTIVPTKAPTKTPTTSPTTTPTKSQAPTTSAITNPTKAPTKTPTTSPTTAPTKSQAPTTSAITNPTTTSPTIAPTTSSSSPPSSRLRGICVKRFDSCTIESNDCCSLQDSCAIGGFCRPNFGNQKDDGRAKLPRASNFDFNRRKLKVRGA
jgi:hypothetical protein